LRLAAERFQKGESPAGLDEALARRTRATAWQAHDTLDRLTKAGALRRVADMDGAYVPRTDPARMSLADAVLPVRETPLRVPESASGKGNDPFDRWLAERFAEAEAAERQALSAAPWPEK
jgi:hypothetical protein